MKMDKIIVFYRLWNRRGQALLVIMVLMAVMLIIGSAAVSMGIAVRRNAVQDVWQKKAYYIAEAGVRMALADLRQRLIYPAPGFKEFAIHARAYAGGVIDEVSVAKEINGKDIYYTITSTSHYPAVGSSYAKKSIKVRVRAVPDPFLYYGGPGLKSEMRVYLAGRVESAGGSFLSRAGDVESEAMISGNLGGIYAGGNVCLKGEMTEGWGKIEAGKDVYILGVLSAWDGEIWAGNEVHDPELQLGKEKVYEHCGSHIPGFPLPKFPFVDKGGAWCDRVKREAISMGHYFENKGKLLDEQIQWSPQLVQLPWPCDDFYLVNVDPCLELSGVNFIDGPFVLNPLSLQEAYDRWKERFRQEHNGEEIFLDDSIPSWFPEEIVDFVKGMLRPVILKIAVGEEGATIVADEIAFDIGIGNNFGINTLGVKGPFGIFSTVGDVVYRVLVGSSGRLSVISAGKFDCLTEENIELDWVAARKDIVVNAIINLDAAKAVVPPGMPVGYQIVSWE